MTAYNLEAILKAELKNGSSDLVTRPTGQTIRDRIERGLVREADGVVIAIDFSDIGVIDYSCADEVVAKLVSRLVSGEYGDKYVRFTGLNENQKENIEVALERKGLAAIVEMRGGKKTILGSLNNYLVETLTFIFGNGKVTAAELSRVLKLPPNTSGTRLLNLYKKRLVRRTSEKRDDGKVWVYEAI
jgi:hypothetical protein